MAEGTDKKLVIAVVVLAGLGGIVWYQNKKQKEEAQSYTAEGRQAALPKLEISEEQSKSVDKITIQKPPGDAGKGSEVTLEKQNDKWKVTGPLTATANDTNVTSLVGNLKSLKITEQIDPSKDAYEKFGLADGKALHAVFYKGAEKVAEFWFGENGTRGQMTRIAGMDGVFAVKGYSSWLYERELKDWRDRGIFKFEADKVVSVDVQNEHGDFTFVRDAKDKKKWVGKFKKAKAAGATVLERFDEAKVNDAINAYKGLNADNFGSDKKAADTGLEKPSATITFTLDDGAKKVLMLGGAAEGSSRWAKTSTSEEIISVASFAADWATADVAKYQKPDPKAKGDAGAEPPPMPMGMPPGMQMPPGMGAPPGMEDDGHGHGE